MRYIFALFLLLFIFGCAEDVARKPIAHKTNSFLKESIKRNKSLLKKELNRIKTYIKKDSLNHYISTAKGFWYAYLTKGNRNTQKPEKGDTVTFEMSVYSVSDILIYSKDELGGELTYVLDEEDKYFSGLRDLLFELYSGDHVIAYFPSELAYGYHGDEAKILPNLSIKCNINIKSIIKKQS